MAANLIEELDARHDAMKVCDLTELLGVDDKHIYRRGSASKLSCRERSPIRPSGTCKMAEVKVSSGALRPQTSSSWRDFRRAFQ